MDFNVQRTITKDILDRSDPVHILYCVLGEFMLGCISIVIDKYKVHSIPTVIDIDSLWNLTNNANLNHGFMKAVINPNSIAFRLSTGFL